MTAALTVNPSERHSYSVYSVPVYKEHLAAQGHPTSIFGKYLEGGVRVCGDAVLRYFWCGFAEIFILTRGIAVSKQ